MTKIIRCSWAALDDPLMEAYHDKEWGVPVHDDQKHFEFLVLEGAQAGLNWMTILKRREEYRKAFSHFDPEVVARFNQHKVEQLLQNSGIIRNKLKINSAITNAQKFLEVQEEFGTFDKYIWQFVNGKPIQNKRKNCKEIPAQTKESQELSKDLRKRGFTFVGPTIIYAHMQAIGMVNDHCVDCFRYKQLFK